MWFNRNENPVMAPALVFGKTLSHRPKSSESVRPTWFYPHADSDTPNNVDFYISEPTVRKRPFFAASTHRVSIFTSRCWIMVPGSLRSYYRSCVVYHGVIINWNLIDYSLTSKHPEEVPQGIPFLLWVSGMRQYLHGTLRRSLWHL